MDRTRSTLMGGAMIAMSLVPGCKQNWKSFKAAADNGIQYTWIDDAPKAFISAYTTRDTQNTNKTTAFILLGAGLTGLILPGVLKRREEKAEQKRADDYTHRSKETFDIK